MLEIRNLEVSCDDKSILNGIDLNLEKGVHAIMGPNGSGKSTLAQTIVGNSDYEVDNGQIVFNGTDLLSLKAHERSVHGVFCAFQYPVAISGISAMYFLRTMVNTHLQAQGKETYKVMELMKIVGDLLPKVGLSQEHLKRDVNVGFSGGEKKRFEILQMLLLKPKLIVLDELDSGLDVDALKIISQSIQSMRKPSRSFILITHYHRILEQLDADYVHILSKGKIVKTGTKKLAEQIENQGFKSVLESE